MSNCTSGCPTQDHSSYAECLQSKSLRTVSERNHESRDYKGGKLWETEIKEYRAARSQGIKPRSTALKDIRSAVERSKKADAPVKDAT